MVFSAKREVKMDLTDPKLAQLAKAPKPGKMPDVTGWVMEPKLDGWRILVSVESNGVRYFGRSGMEYSGHTPALDKELLQLPVGTVLDCEMIHPQGWRFVQTVLGSESKQSDELELVVFDVLQIELLDMRNQTLFARRKALKHLFGWADFQHVSLIEQSPYTPDAVEALIESGAEGAVVKDPQSLYVGGRRSSWLKLKVSASMDMVVMGGVEGKGEKTGRLAVLKCGQIRNGELHWRATCWGKIDLELADELDRKWKSGELEGMVVEVSHLGVAHTGKFRAPIVERIRTDKLPEQCEWTEDDGTWYQLG